MSRARTITALRYLTRFQCAGAECIDTCCAGWRVLVDEPSYVQLTKKLALGERDFAERVPLLPKNARTRGAHATFAMVEPGNRCTFLEADRLCGLQQAHGEAALPDVCAEYPRKVHRVGVRTELSGATSCPEVVRLLLFERDAAELVEASSTLLRRVDPAVGDGPSGAHAAMLDLLRGAFTEFITLPGLPLQSRLFIVAAAALRIAPALTHTPIRTRAVEAMLDELAQPAVHETLHAVAQRECVATGAATETVVRALLLRSAAPRQPHYAALMRAILPHLVATSGGAVTTSDAGYALDTERLLPIFAARRAALYGRFGALLGVAQTNLVRHALFSMAPGLTMTRFPHFAVGLVVRAAMQTFLLAFHPDVDDALAQGSEPKLRGILQQGVYLLARGLEHNAELGKAFHAAARERASTLPETAALAALC